MPSDRVRIVRVTGPWPTRVPFVQSFTIDAEDAEIPMRSHQYTTVSAWLGSLCQRAYEQQQITEIVWKQSRYGQQVVSVEPQTS